MPKGQYKRGPRGPYKPVERPLALTTISLGAGVQSTALLLCSIKGWFDVPEADCAIFADTGDEPDHVYEHLEFLQNVSPIPIHVVSSGHLSHDSLDPERTRFAAMPLYIRNRSGKAAMLRRQCTREYKLDPIYRKIRELLGYGKHEWVRKTAKVLIGISADEAHRMKPARFRWLENHWPLVDARLTRGDCREILTEAGWPIPEKSACVFCPFRSNGEWAHLRAHYPHEFQKAVDFEKSLQSSPLRHTVDSPLYLHQNLVPLDQVDFDSDADTGPDGFGNECEGLCGV